MTPVELHDLTGDRVRFNRYLYSDSVDRIMFVRHPVRRLLSGFLQVARVRKESFWESYGFEDQGFGPDGFRTFMMNSSFIFEYDGTCSRSSTFFSIESWSQHWAPPQHCRCGISECGVEWKVYKIEEHTIGEIMDQYIPGPWIPPYNITTKNNSKKKPTPPYNNTTKKKRRRLELSYNTTTKKKKKKPKSPYNITTKKNITRRSRGKESGKYHSTSYNEKEYLTPEVLEFLNDLTKNEREFYGYEPIKF